MKIIKKFPLLSSLVVIAALAFGISFWTGAFGGDQEAAVLSSSQATPGPTGVLVVAEEGKSLTYVGEEGVSILASLKTLADVETNQFSFGEFVSSVNGIEAEEDKNFWAFYVNGEQAQVGADNLIAEKGDLVEWKLEDIEF